MKILSYREYLIEHKRQLRQSARRWRALGWAILASVPAAVWIGADAVILGRYLFAAGMFLTAAMELLGAIWGAFPVARGYRQDYAELSPERIERAVTEDIFARSYESRRRVHEDELRHYVAASNIVAVVDPVESQE